MPKTIFLTAILITAWSLLSGQAPEARLAQANAAYQGGDYEQAVETYESLLAEGLESEALYYNLGNAYFRQGRLGRAVLNYERARLLDPADADIRHNLAIARGQLPERFEAVPEFFLLRWWRGAHQLAAATTWAVLGLALCWLGVAGLIVWLLAGTRETRKRGFFAGLVLLLLSGLPFALAAGQAAYERDTGFAVVIDAEATLRSGADARSAPVEALPPGVKVRLLDVIGDWHKVRLANGEEGWLPAGAFVAVAVGSR